MCMPLAYYVHNLDPFVFRVNLPFIGSWGPRWYGLAYLMGFLFAYLLIKKLSKDGMLRLNPQRVPDLVLNCCIFGVLVGGRLGYVLFYNLPIALSNHQTPLLWDFSSSLPYWGVIKVWDGGMSAHGGILFTILAILWFSRKYKAQGANLINIGDASCMVVPIGLFFGRIANFINGELYGHPTTVPWAVKFPSEIYSPTNGQIDPSILDKLPGIYQKLQLPLDWFGKNWQDEGLNQLSRLLVQHDPAALNAVIPILPPRHPSQLYEALLEGAFLFLICWTIGRLWRKDGMASGAFLTLYPVMRIIGEQFRVGDTPATIFGMQISKGILYSIPLFIAGAVYWGYWIKKDRRIPWVPPSPPASSTPAPEPSPKTA